MADHVYFHSQIMNVWSPMISTCFQLIVIRTLASPKREILWYIQSMISLAKQWMNWQRKYLPEDWMRHLTELTSYDNAKENVMIFYWNSCTVPLEWSEIDLISNTTHTPDPESKPRSYDRNCNALNTQATLFYNKEFNNKSKTTCKCKFNRDLKYFLLEAVIH